ncbi:MAG: LON peptidase substrate-binding domain-containing protein [Thermomicrobiales bacterium]
MAEQLPLFPLNTVLYPGMPLPLHIFEERYRRLLRIRAGEETVFGVILVKSTNANVAPLGMYPVGTAARLVTRRSMPDGRSDIVITGTRRFRVHAENWAAGYCLADITWLEDEIGNPARVEELLEESTRRFARYVEGVTRITGREFDGVRISDDPIEAAYDLTTRLPLHTWERQRILEIDTTESRLELILGLIKREVALLFKAGAAGLAINHPGNRFAAN